LKHAFSVPSELTPLALVLIKWGLSAHTVIATKPERAIMVQVRMLNFFIVTPDYYYLLIFGRFCCLASSGGK
jgi:hypothetical protein